MQSYSFLALKVWTKPETDGQTHGQTDTEDRQRQRTEPAYKGSVLQFWLQEHENAQSRLKRQCVIPLNTSYIDILKSISQVS